VEELDGITRYFKSKPADVAVLTTESTTGNWTAATFARGCDPVFTNPARTCHHTDPEAKAISKGQAILRLKVYLVRGRGRTRGVMCQPPSGFSARGPQTRPESDAGGNRLFNVASR
jgi:hypothetical protein